jgi:hypothetical protein
LGRRFLNPLAFFSIESSNLITLPPCDISHRPPRNFISFKLANLHTPTLVLAEFINELQTLNVVYFVWAFNTELKRQILLALQLRKGFLTRFSLLKRLQTILLSGFIFCRPFDDKSIEGRKEFYIFSPQTPTLFHN